MKQKKILSLFDWLLWSFIGLVPLIFKNTVLTEYITNLNDLIPGIETSFLMTNIKALFDFLDISANAEIYYIICWFVIVELTHLVVDILLFIPRYFHKIIDGGLKNE